VKTILQRYIQHIKKRNRNLLFLFVLYLLIPFRSFPALLETTLERSGNIVYTHISLFVLPEEEISGIQLEFGYDIQNWEFDSAYPGETLYASGKQLQVAPVYGTLRIVIIGFNNYPITSGTLLSLQFNALSEGIDGAGFRILQAKLSSPQALPVNGTIKGNEKLEPTVNNDTEKDTNFVETNTSTTATDSTHQTKNKTSDMTNIPGIQSSHKTTQEYTQSPPTKSYHSVLSSGFVPDAGTSYHSHNRKYYEDKRRGNYTGGPNLISKTQNNPVVGQQMSNNRTASINVNTNIKGTDSKTPLINSRTQRTLPTKPGRETISSAPDEIIFNKNPESNTIPPGDINKPTYNSYLALNTSNLPKTRGRNNECINIEEADITIDSIGKENSLILFVSIIIILIITPILLSIIIPKWKLFYRIGAEGNT